MSEAKIPTEVPLSLLEAHAALAVECDHWQETWAANSATGGETLPPPRLKTSSTEFVCYVAQQPHVAIDEIESTALQGVVVCFVLGAGLGVFVLHPLFRWSASKLEQWFPLGRSRRTPT